MAQAYQAEIALREGELDVALRWADGFAQAQLRYSGSRFHEATITYLAVLVVAGDPERLRRARELLSELRGLYETCHNTLFLARVLAIEASLHERTGEREKAEQALARAVELTGPGRAVTIFVEAGAELIPVMQRLALEGDREHAGRVLAALRNGPARDSVAARSTRSGEVLSAREAEVLGLLAERLADKEIAARLHISVGTVRRHTQSIYGKLGVHGRREAVAKATGLGLLSVPS